MFSERLARGAPQHGVDAVDAGFDRRAQTLEAELDEPAYAHLRRDQVRLEPVRRVHDRAHALRVVERLEVHRAKVRVERRLEERANRLAATARRGRARGRRRVQLVREGALVRVAAAQDLVHERAAVLEVRRGGSQPRELEIEIARAGLDGFPNSRDLAPHPLAENARERVHQRVRADVRRGRIARSYRERA